MEMMETFIFGILGATRTSAKQSNGKHVSVCHPGVCQTTTALDSSIAGIGDPRLTRPSATPAVCRHLQQPLGLSQRPRSKKILQCCVATVGVPARRSVLSLEYRDRNRLA